MAGSLLFKHEIESLLLGPSSIIAKSGSSTSGMPRLTTKNASLDLTIGDIFIPDAKDGEPGSLSCPLTRTCLKQGQTVVIRTSETLAMPKGISAVGFPPSSEISLPGLLTTNPGIVDPGFTGRLHPTVINMGKKEFPLTQGDRVMRLMLFRDAAISGGADDEKGPGPLKRLNIMSQLSPDFLNITERTLDAATAAVKEAELKARWMALWIPLCVAVVSVIGAILVSHYSTEKDLIADRESLTAQIQAVDEKYVRLEAQTNTNYNATELRQLKDRVAQLEAQTSKSGSAAERHRSP
jgi:cell division protein FtsL